MTLRAWGLPAALLVVLGVEVAAWGVLHRSPSELDEAWRSADPLERIGALHVLTNRDGCNPERFGREFVRQVFDEAEDARLREFMMTIDLCKFEPPGVQLFRVELRMPRPPTPEWWRSFIFLKHKVGGGRVGANTRLELRDLEWTLQSLEGRMPPPEMVYEHLRRLEQEAAERRKYREFLEEE